MFQLNAVDVIRAKVKKCEQTLLFNATNEDTHHWRSKVGEDCSSLLACSPQWSDPREERCIVSCMTDMKRGLVRCFHNRAKGITNIQDNLQKEVEHLARVLKQNGYPAN